MNRYTTTTALALVAMLSLGLVPTTVASHDDDLIPDEAEATACGTGQLPEGVCNGDDLNVFGLPMATVLGPACEATDNQSSDVCNLQFVTLGMVVCMVRASAPGANAVLLCSSNGQVAVHCSSAGPEGIVVQLISDADCDGHSNDTELAQGCDPLDRQSYPTGPGECSAGGGGTQPPPVECSGSTDPLVIIAQIASDADCDGHSNDTELVQGCNPFDPASQPTGPMECSGDGLPV